MAESTPNDIAFIKVSQELRRVENSIAVLDNLRMLASQAGQYTISKLQEVKDGEIYTPEIQSYIPMIRAMCKGGDHFMALKSTMEKRRELLRDLTDTYLQGGNIVQAKLARDS